MSRRGLLLTVLSLALSCNGSPSPPEEPEARTAALTAPAPMDVVPTGSVDVAGIWQNPMWGIQQTQPGTLADPQACLELPGGFRDPGCTTQSTSFDYPSGLYALICAFGASTEIYGHVNWRAADYLGKIFWGGKSTDSDYNVRMPTVNRNGLTIYNTTSMHGEFDSRETINYFSSPWWTSFRSASDSSKKTMIDGKEALMVGLMGVDCEHDCGSEIHPIWALAIHVKDDPNDDVWAVFARNWGNEGFCSSNQHLISFPANRYTFTFPWRAGATGVTLGSGTVFYGNKSGMSTSWGSTVGQRVTLSMQLLSPSSSGRLHGQLHLKWTGSFAPTALPDPVRIGLPREEGGDRALEALAAMLDARQRTEFERAGAVAVAHDAVSVPLSRGRSQPPTDLSRAALHRVADPATAHANQRVVMALRAAYGRPFPGDLGAAVERAFAAQP